MPEAGDVQHAREDVLKLFGDLISVDLVNGEIVQIVDARALDDCGRTA